MTSIIHSPESDLALAASPQPLGGALQRDYPEVEAVARLDDSSFIIRQGADVFAAENFYFSEPSIFRVFLFRFLEGSAEGALTQPNSIVLNRRMEKKYFGDKPALGETLICNGSPWKVTAVVADRPANSDLAIDALLSKNFENTDWNFDDFTCYTFVLFHQMPDLRRFNKKLASLDKYTRPMLDQAGAKGWAFRFEAEALREVHFSPGKMMDTPKGNRQFNRIFSALAVFILLIALLNYINRSTARSAERMKEVGVRKVVGARPAQLIRQFLSESALLVALAWIIAIGLVSLGIPLFNRALATKLSFSGWPAILFPILLLPLTVSTGPAAHPAFVLSAFRPVRVLKGGSSIQKGGAAGLRKLFTVIQFMIALAMLAGAVVFYQQMYFMMHKDPGLDRSQILEVGIPIDSVSRAAAPAFAEVLRRESGIHGVSIGSGMPADGVSMSSTTVTSNHKNAR